MNAVKEPQQDQMICDTQMIERWSYAIAVPSDRVYDPDLWEWLWGSWNVDDSGLDVNANQ